MEGSGRYPCKHAVFQGFPSANDPLWETAVKVQLVETQTGETPFLETEFCMLRDDASERFLIRFSGEDDGTHSLFRLRDEPLFRQDVFGLLVGDTDREDQYRDFEVSPNDVLLDGIVETHSGAKPSLNLSLDVAQWKTKTRYDRQKLRTWSVWSLPYGAFSGKPVPGKSWRFNAFRIDVSERGLSRQAWLKTGSASFHEPRFFGFLDFVS